jgi:hypothetical protein
MQKLAVLIAVTALACNTEPPQHGPFDYLFGTPTGRFVQVSSYDTSGGNRDRLEIAPGATATLLDVEGPGVIQRIWITVSSSDPHYLRRIALEMYWDEETEPSVSVPLGDFFGNGFDKRHYTSMLMGVSSGGFYCYLPMPFARHARIVVNNGTGREIDAFYYQIGLVQVDDLPRDVATFHATWNRDVRTATAEPHSAVGTSNTVSSLHRFMEWWSRTMNAAALPPTVGTCSTQSPFRIPFASSWSTDTPTLKSPTTQP